jgi:membrane protease YdiL (CAAX protease family)
MLFIKSPIIAIIISAIIFGYYHIPIFGWTKLKAFLAFLGGLFFGTLFVTTKSLFVVWITHGFGDLGLIHESIGCYIVWTKIRYQELFK